VILDNISWYRVIAAGQRYIECLVSQVWDANTLDPTHSTGMQGIVPLHVHEHGNGRNVTKGSDKISTEGEDAVREGIICRHTGCKLKEFLHKRIDEQVCVLWLLWTRYDPNTKDVVLLEAFVWREIIIEDKEDPRSLLPLFEGSKAVGGKAKCDVTMIREVMVGQMLISNNNTLAKKHAIMKSVENIHCFSRYAGLCMFISTVLEMSGVGVT